MAVRIYEGEITLFESRIHPQTYNVDFQLFRNHVYTLDQGSEAQEILRFTNNFSTYNTLQNFDRRRDPASPTCFLKVESYFLVGFSNGEIFKYTSRVRGPDASFIAFGNDGVARMFFVNTSDGNKKVIAQSSSGKLCYFILYSEGEPRIISRHDVSWFFDAFNDSSRITDVVAIDNMHHVLLVEDKLALVKWQDNVNRYVNRWGSGNRLAATGLAITKDSNNREILCALQNGSIERYRVTDEEEGLYYVSTMRTHLPNIIEACFVNANKIVFLQKLDDSLKFSVFDFSNNILGQHVIDLPDATLGFNVEFKGAQSQNMFYLKLRLRFPDKTICRLQQFLIEVVAAGGSAPERGQKRDAPETSAHRVKEKIMRLMKDLSREERESLIKALQEEQCSCCKTDYNRTEEGDTEDITAVFGECGHTVCTDCEPRLPKPKKCPECRTTWRPAEFALLLI